MKSNRISWVDYGMSLAKVAASRSEDPQYQVGSIAMNKSHQIIAVGYNGLMAGFVTSEGFWDDRDKIRKYIIHSEQNLVSLFKKGEAETVFCTLCPCNSCMTMLIGHGIKTIYYAEEYPKSDAHEIAALYGISLIKSSDGTTL